MGFALFRQHETLRRCTIVIAVRAEGNRQDLLDRCAGVPPLGEGKCTTNHGKGSALLDIFAHVLQIVPGEVELIAEIFKDNQVKIFEFLRKQALGGERNETELAFWHIDDVSRGPQDDEGDHVNARILLQTLTQEAIIPGWAATDQEHANLVTGYRKRKVRLIVLRECFTKVRGHTDGIGKLDNFLRRTCKLYLLLEHVSRDLHCFGSYHTPSALQDYWEMLATISPGLYCDVHLRGIMHKR